MSAIEYNNLLFEISQRLDELNVRERLLFMCRGKLASGSEDIQDVLSLFKELEEKDYLGIDRLKILKEVLKSVREWPLFGKVKNFERKRKEYSHLLEEIIGVLDELNDMERLMSMCRGKVPEGSEGNIQDVRRLLKELENQDHLGVDQLDILKKILTETEKEDLLKKVNEFEKRRNDEEELESRKARASAVVSSVRAAGERIVGEIKIHCTFRKISGAILVVGTGAILHRCSKLEDFVEAFRDAVLPAAAALQAISEGSLCFTVQVENKPALDALWEQYQDGTLQRKLQQFLVNDEIRELADGEEVMVSVYISEQELKTASLDLSTAQTQAGEMDERTDEPEISRLNKTKLMDPGKYAFVQKYLEEDTRSMATEGSDSGLATHAAASELGTEESETNDLRLKDLSKEVTQKLIRGLQYDNTAKEKFYQFFGLKMQDRFRFIEDIEELFPDTTISVLKECFVAVQLYDLAELLEKVRPRSLRPALYPEEIEKLQNADDRPTRYHSNVAVLIVDYSDKMDITDRDSDKKIETFFKDLSWQNEVVIASTISQETRGILQRITQNKQFVEYLQQREKTESEHLEKAMMRKEAGESGRVYPPSVREQQVIFALSHEMDRYMEEGAQLREQIANDIKKIKELEKETERAISTAVDKWIQNQDKFTCVAVFVMGDTSCRDIIAEKFALIPDHAKLLVSPYGWENIGNVPETLHVMYPGMRRYTPIFTCMAEIFNKRWQTLDFTSMMQEFQRTCYRKSSFDYIFVRNFTIKDNLSTRLRFQNTEEKSS